MLKLKNTLAIHDFTFWVISKSKIAIKDIAKWDELKLDGELTKSICMLIEDEFEKAVYDKENTKKLSRRQAKTIDKKELVKQIFKEMFDLTHDEVDKLDSDIQLLYNNKMIGYKSLWKRIRLFLKKPF